MQQCHGPLQRGPSSYLVHPLCVYRMPQNTFPLSAEGLGVKQQQPQLWEVPRVVWCALHFWTVEDKVKFGKLCCLMLVIEVLCFVIPATLTCAGSSGAAWRTLRQGLKSWSKCVSNPLTHRVTAESRGRCRGLLAHGTVLAPLTVLNSLILQVRLVL